MIANPLDHFLSSRKSQIDQFLQSMDWSDPIEVQGWQKLRESVRYSLLQNGKRFRSVLILLLSENFDGNTKEFYPFAAAIEMIHTYSLIHDDLPCMDNDDFRRGEPSNHKTFGEGIALLAGDALQAEAFQMIAKSYAHEPAIGLKLTAVLGQAAGMSGMAGGQAIDIDPSRSSLNLKQLERMHKMKTGALIRASCEGAGIILRLDSHKLNLVKNFGDLLGLAFQLQDDILDSSEEDIEVGSFPGLIGLEKTRQYLEEISAKARQVLSNLGIEKGPLLELIVFNQNRLV